MQATTNAETAIWIAHKFQPDGVVSDVQLGTESGADLIRRLRAENFWVPCVLMTGRTDYLAPADIADVPVVYKPFEPEVIVRALKSVPPPPPPAAA